MPTKATTRQQRYDEKSCKNYHFKLNLKLDADIIDKLSAVPSMQGYIKQLIRNDLASDNPVAPAANPNVKKEEE